MPSKPYELLEKVNDETSFLEFFRALREDCEEHERTCPRNYHRDCSQFDHWETHSTKDYLNSIEDWASGGDFAAGVHHGEPLLRRFATMLYVGRNYRPEDRPR